MLIEHCKTVRLAVAAAPTRVVFAMALGVLCPTTSATDFGSEPSIQEGQAWFSGAGTIRTGGGSDCLRPLVLRTVTAWPRRSAESWKVDTFDLLSGGKTILSVKVTDVRVTPDGASKIHIGRICDPTEVSVGKQIVIQHVISVDGLDRHRVRSNELTITEAL